MANTLRIKRRAAGGAAGAPATLAAAELAYNEQDDTLYYGKGDVSGTASTVIPIAGSGAFTPIAHAGSGGAAHALAIASGANGFMSGADKSKLDGVAAGATNYSHPTGDGNIHVPATSTTNNGKVLTAGSTAGSVSWVAPLALTAVAPSADAASASVGVGTAAAREDHAHAYPTAANVGAMATSHAANSITGFGASAAALGASAAGSATTISRSDHVHAMPVLSALGVPTADVAFGAYKITGLGAPVNPTDATNKNYVDTMVQGLSPKTGVRVATAAAGTLASSFANGSVVDGITLVTGDRILIKDQAAPAENGVYTVNASGAPTRSSDADTWAELPSAYLFVQQGTTNAEMGFVCTSDAGGTLGTTAITFQQFNGAGQVTAGSGLSKTGNTLSVAASGVTLAMMANIGTGSLLYRKTAGSGAPEENTLATLKTDLGLVGTNGGDNATNSQYSGLVTNATHTGDVTGATVLTVAAGAVTYAKMQNISATSRVLGRITAGAGVTEELTGANLATIIGITSTAANVTSVGGNTGVVTNAQLATSVNGLVTSLAAGASCPGALGSTSATVTAAGTNQATATVLSSDVNIITSSSSGTGVVVPGATSGKYAVIVNRSANPINIYPASGHAFDGLAANAAISLPVNGFLEMFGSSTTQWHTTVQALVSGSFVSGNIAGSAAGLNAANVQTLQPYSDGIISGGFDLRTTAYTTPSIRFLHGSTAAVQGWLNLSTTGLQVTGAANTYTIPVYAQNFVSSVATGTSPLTVASTTLVTNLNANYVGGVALAGLVQTSSIIDGGTF